MASITTSDTAPNSTPHGHLLLEVNESKYDPGIWRGVTTLYQY